MAGRGDIWISIFILTRTTKSYVPRHDEATDSHEHDHDDPITTTDMRILVAVAVDDSNRHARPLREFYLTNHSTSVLPLPARQGSFMKMAGPQ